MRSEVSAPRENRTPKHAPVPLTRVSRQRKPKCQMNDRAGARARTTKPRPAVRGLRPRTHLAGWPGRAGPRAGGRPAVGPQSPGPAAPRPPAARRAPRGQQAAGGAAARRMQLPAPRDPALPSPSPRPEAATRETRRGQRRPARPQRPVPPPCAARGPSARLCAGILLGRRRPSALPGRPAPPAPGYARPPRAPPIVSSQQRRRRGRAKPWLPPALRGPRSRALALQASPASSAPARRAPSRRSPPAGRPPAAPFPRPAGAKASARSPPAPRRPSHEPPARQGPAPPCGAPGWGRPARRGPGEERRGRGGRKGQPNLGQLDLPEEGAGERAGAAGRRTNPEAAAEPSCSPATPKDMRVLRGAAEEGGDPLRSCRQVCS